MMCGTVENWAEGMDSNGGSLPKWCEKTDFFTYVSDSLVFFQHNILNLLGLS
jgi:hypothetical protein